MSVRVSRAVLDRSASRGAARLVLLGLADRADDRGCCWPGMADIAHRSGLSTERAVRRAIGELVKLGELTVERGGGRRRTNVYRIMLPVDGDETRTGAQGFPGRENPDHGAEKPGQPRIETRTTAPENPDRRAGGTNREPSREPPQNRTPGPNSGSAPVAAVAVPPDAAAAEFDAYLADRRGKAARCNGATRPVSIGTALPDGLAGRRRRIPSDEQAQSRQRLGSVQGLGADDAADLAMTYPLADLQRAVSMLPAVGAENPGGWLRACVEKRWWEGNRDAS